MSLEALCVDSHEGQWVSESPVMVVDSVGLWAPNILIQRAVIVPNTIEFAVAFAVFAIGFT